jgi:hypothetical protein
MIAGRFAIAGWTRGCDGVLLNCCVREYTLDEDWRAGREGADDQEDELARGPVGMPVEVVGTVGVVGDALGAGRLAGAPPHVGAASAAGRLGGAPPQEVVSGRCVRSDPNVPLLPRICVEPRANGT